MAIEYDKATKKWFREHPDAVSTVVKCEHCNLYYKPSLGHACKKGIPKSDVTRKLVFDSPIDKLVYELELRHMNLLELQDRDKNQDLYSEIEFVEKELKHYKKLLR